MLDFIVGLIVVVGAWFVYMCVSIDDRKIPGRQ